MRYWTPFLLVCLTLGGFIAAESLPDFAAGFYNGFLGPFLIAAAAGMGLENAWRALQESMMAGKVPAGVMAITGVLGALVLFSMLGLQTLWQEPWLFGAAVFPGLSMARPWLEGRLRADRPLGDAGDAPPRTEKP